MLVSPLDDLVGVDPLLSRNSRDRHARNKRRLHDAALLLSGTVNPFRTASRRCNLNRFADKAIVGLIAPCVYTARSGSTSTPNTMRGYFVRGDETRT
jgi:hypothetical protein